ncbi:MAG: flavodoxin-dependent (E)-4-hydroxy-3-methylbut-2-enyl-diphosphate synthase [Eubacteriales bacterium]|nr:flavodoxin-dependent (E)-4-hydroxy-3-methylbut-2-enyl-diphosphate synthase [Eubacteriales bacterium]
MFERKYTRPINVGGVIIGGLAPIAIQSMNNTDPRDIAGTIRQIEALAEAGCDLTRLAVPDLEAADAFAAIRRRSPLPIVADIHFDYRLALAAIKAGADKIRINPGNIGGPDRVRQVVEAVRERQIPIRVGVNSGSLSREVIDRFGGVNAQSMVASALEAVAMLEAWDFQDVVISIKASDPALTIETYRLLSAKTNYPLHLGVTEAGTRREGAIRSAVGIGTLLAEGIGDTLRVSLTAEPVAEIEAAYSILQALGLRRRGPELISCPTCGRTSVDLIGIAGEVEERLKKIKTPLKVAVMGCAVNGPGEARHADVGIAGGKGEFLIFVHGEIIKKVPEAEAVEALMAEIARLSGV